MRKYNMSKFIKKVNKGYLNVIYRFPAKNTENWRTKFQF